MKKNITFSEINDTEILFTNISCIKQAWSDKETFSYLETPRNNSGIILATHCNINYYFSTGKRIQLPKDSVMILPKDINYSVEIDLPKPQQTSSVTINFDMFDKNFDSLTFKEPKILIERKTPNDIHEIFNDIADTYIASAKNTFLLKSKLYHLIHTLISTVENRHFSHKNNTVYKAVNYIENNLNEQISVPALARLCTTSEATLRHNFKAITGMSPIEYMNALKIRKAQQLLQIPEITVNTICEQLNFYDTSYFYKLFKRHTNMTPIQYRKQFLN